MANPEHVEILKQGVDVWNRWRKKDSKTKPNLNQDKLNKLELKGYNFLEAEMNKAQIIGCDFESCDFYGASLIGSTIKSSNFKGAGFSFANLTRTNFKEVDMSYSNLRNAIAIKSQFNNVCFENAELNGIDLSKAKIHGNSSLYHADLSEAILINATLNKVTLDYAKLVNAQLYDSTIINCTVFGVSAWYKGVPKKQHNLRFTDVYDDDIRIDDLNVAQFLNVVLNNHNLTIGLENISSVIVLILGRFSSSRKEILDDLRNELREHGFVSIIFDFEKPSQLSLTRTVKLLAHMSTFIIADLTSAKSVALELQAIVPDIQVPVIPIIQKDEEPFAMFHDLNAHYDWVLDPVSYDSDESLVSVLKPGIIDRAVKKASQIRRRENRKYKSLSTTYFE